MNCYCGIDWAEGHHDVAIVGNDGKLVAKKRIGDDPAGFTGLTGMLAEAGDSPEDPIPIAIETPRGLMVAALHASGRPVFAINPMAAARYRERSSVARAKSDHADAMTLANILRVDAHVHRTLPADSELAQAIAVLARSQQNAVWRRSKATNELRSRLSPNIIRSEPGDHQHEHPRPRATQCAAHPQTHRHARNPRRPAGPDPRRHPRAPRLPAGSLRGRDRPPRIGSTDTAHPPSPLRRTINLRILRLHRQHQTPPAMLRDLAALRWLDAAESVILYGPVGVGKTHMAQALGHAVARRGGDVRFAKTSRVLSDLAGGHADRTWGQRIREYTKPLVLILDDFAMREHTAMHADDLYELISDRAVNGKPLILTSNRSPKDWYNLFPNPVVAESLLDRLINGTVTLVSVGDRERSVGEYRNGVVQGPPLPGGDHQSLRVAVLSVLVELS